MASPSPKYMGHTRCRRPTTLSRPDATATETAILVWDRFIRLFHWSLVAALATAATTGFLAGPPWLAWHITAGLAAAAAILWRLVWGWLGTTHARFADFLPTPGTISDHLRGAPAETPGHNPLGSLMVFAFLAAIPTIAAAGTIALGGMFKQGPLHALAYSSGRESLTLHEALAIVLLGMIALHLAGVAIESRRERQNLVAAMIHGRKTAPRGAVGAQGGHAIVAAAVTAFLLAAIAIASAALMRAPRHDWPPPPTATVALQCGACHLAFPPNLAPSTTWNAILDDLKHHFGADATLSTDQIAEIGAYYDANAAEHSDTLPAHMVRVPAADGSRRITDTPGWRRRHRDIADATFTRPPIYRRSNCAVCHADAASGAFAPQSIAVP